LAKPGKPVDVAKPGGSRGDLVPTVEARDPTLSAALLELAMSPTPETHRRVAERYRELGILDAAYDHFDRARQLDPTDAVAHEGLARVWRDWGFPHLGLADASRAVYFAPSRATVYNTLGTLLAGTGRQREARRAWEHALALEPRAAYVLNNLCYLSFLQGETTNALAECHAALAIDPELTAARNNLALVDAARGRDDLAKRELLAARDAAAGLYNIGILDLAAKHYASAVAAFEAAHRERPSWAEAHERALQARRLLRAAASE
jgi:tetratricopeptide (TPR) repeat protein